jgi:diguanylate cyclase (GGDEF)-like protein
MRLSVKTDSEDLRRNSSLYARPSVALVIVLLLLAIGWLDYATGTAPFEHLYYLPILLAACLFDYTGGLISALIAIGLYHMANAHLRALHYDRSDYFQVALFLIVGGVTARLAQDRRQMQRLAHTDDLTGLHNLRGFEIRLERIISDAKLRGTSASMLVLDVDGLKRINDIYGHIAGAEAVREVGHLIAEVLNDGAVACRYGGDEFAIAISGDELKASTTAERLRKSVELKSPILAGKPFPAGSLTISIGIATCRPLPNQHAELVGEKLFRSADDALYQAKREGRNRVRLMA